MQRTFTYFVQIYLCQAQRKVYILSYEALQKHVEKYISDECDDYNALDKWRLVHRFNMLWLKNQTLVRIMKAESILDKHIKNYNKKQLSEYIKDRKLFLGDDKEDD